MNREKRGFFWKAFICICHVLQKTNLFNGDDGFCVFCYQSERHWDFTHTTELDASVNWGASTFSSTLHSPAQWNNSKWNFIQKLESLHAMDSVGILDWCQIWAWFYSIFLNSMIHEFLYRFERFSSWCVDLVEDMLMFLIAVIWSRGNLYSQLI